MIGLTADLYTAEKRISGLEDQSEELSRGNREKDLH